MSSWIARRVASAARWIAGLNPIECAVAAFVLVVSQMVFWPWLQHARERSRSVQTRENLRRVGTAVFNYADTHRSLPMGGRISPVREGTVGERTESSPQSTSRDSSPAGH